MTVNVSCVGKLSDKYPAMELYAKTPFEIIGLMEANYPGFKQDLLTHKYGLVLYSGEDEEVEAEGVVAERMMMPFSQDHAMFVPIPRGEAGTAFFWVTSQIVTYTGITSMVGVYLAAAVAAVVIGTGISLALSGLASLIMPDTPDTEDNVTGYQFNGPVNTSRQGAPVPVCYGGPILVGSQVISVALATEDIPV